MEQLGVGIIGCGAVAEEYVKAFERDERSQVRAYQTQTENPIEYPGTISVNVKFCNGAIGRTTTSFDAQMPYRFNIGVYGTEGSLRNDQLYAPKLFPEQQGFLRIPCVLPDSGAVDHHPFQGEIAHFLDCVVDDLRPSPDFEDAAKTQAVCFAADLSAESGRPVKISELEGLP